jgi:2'-5' RNA ligase superfamily
MSERRLQLTLFVDASDSAMIERVRQTYNPLQYALIKAHITLCREDEIVPLELVLENLRRLQHSPIAIDFGEVQRFSEGNGVLMPAIGDQSAFHKLRAAILKGIIEVPRIHGPHLTLMHPRNATCTDEIFAEIKAQQLPMRLIFSKICLISQEIGNEWELVEAFRLQS